MSSQVMCRQWLCEVAWCNSNEFFDLLQNGNAGLFKYEVWNCVPYKFVSKWISNRPVKWVQGNIGGYPEAQNYFCLAEYLPVPCFLLQLCQKAAIDFSTAKHL